MPIPAPDLSDRPFYLQVQRIRKSPPKLQFLGWTQEFDRWFATPGSVLMRPEIDEPYSFETFFDSQRHPHYGRFLKIIEGQLVEMTWLTLARTKGPETILRVEFFPHNQGSSVRLTHKGFMDEESKTGHLEAWPSALDILDRAYSGHSSTESQ